MAIISVGYDGQIDEVSWAKMQAALGRVPGGIDGNAWVPTIKQGVTTPQVTIQAGSGMGHGVYDTLDVNTDVPIPNPPTTSGATRWDAVVMRRSWAGAGGVSTLSVVAGNTSPILPATLNDSPGVVADEPICLAQVTAGQALVTALIDLRAWPTFDVFWPHDEPPQASRYRYGQHVIWRSSQIGACHLVRRGNPGAEVWDNLDDPPWSALNIGGGMIAMTSTPQYRVCRGHLEMQGGGARSPSSGGGVWTSTTNVDVLVGTLPSNLAPAVHSPFVFPVTGGMRGNARGTINTDGQIQITLLGNDQFTGVYYDVVRYPVKTGL
jgi:hypothetical protein